MKYILNFKIYESEVLVGKNHVDIKSKIKYLKKIPKEYKEFALTHLKSYTSAKNGVITNLQLHNDLIKKIEEKGYPKGFDMGVDKNGYFIHTHRARSKSKESPNKITKKEIFFIDSTG